MYANGDGIPENDEVAAKWFRLAAEQGDALSMSNLGAMYANGEGVEQDVTIALEFFTQAAELGELRQMLANLDAGR